MKHIQRPDWERQRDFETLTARRLLPESSHQLIVCELHKGVVLFCDRGRKKKGKKFIRTF